MLTIASPGIQITETDLSNTSATTKGTTIFLAGYSSQGPTDEVISPTTMSEFEQIFGLPTTPSERYFYHSAQQIIQSNGNLLTTRLPYGSGSGLGFTDSYSALFYPVVSSGSGFIIGKPSQYNLNSLEYANLTQNNFAWSNIPLSGTPNATWDGAIANSGIIVVNTSQTTINEKSEGYYISFYVISKAKLIPTQLLWQ